MIIFKELIFFLLFKDASDVVSSTREGSVGEKYFLYPSSPSLGLVLHNRAFLCSLVPHPRC